VRGLLLLAMVCLSCGTRSGLPARTVDAKPEVATVADARARDAAVPDAEPGADDALTGTDHSGPADLPLAADGVSGCTSLPVTWLPEPLTVSCPPTSTPAACGGNDLGVVVARSAACVNAWGEIPFQCATWTGPATGEEIVVLKLANCTDLLDSVEAFACGDHIELSYLGHGTCQSCDGKRSDLRVFSLPLDARPVVANGQIVEPPCLPPDPATGGATGTGGTTGAGGMTGTGGATVTGGTGTSPTCARTPISETIAAAEFRAYTFAANPNYNPEASFAAEEITLPGLWDQLYAQLFTGKVAVGDSAPTLCSFFYRECALTPVTGDCGWFGMISSGLVASGAFYFSWNSGSGVFRSTLGKLAPEGAGLLRTTSIDYFNPSSGPPGLVVAREGEQLLVYRATVYWGDFNEWTNPELMGTLKDFGDRLAVVDNDGEEIPSTLP